MTRIEALRKRLAAATEIITFGKSVPVQAVEIEMAEHLTQDLRDLLELYGAALKHRDAELAFAKMATGASMKMYREIMDRPEIKTVYGAMLQAREVLDAILSTLDSPVGDEGAVE